MRLKEAKRDESLWHNSFDRKSMLYTQIEPLGQGNLMHWASKSYGPGASRKREESQKADDEILFSQGLPHDVLEAIEEQLSMSFSGYDFEQSGSGNSDSPLTNNDTSSTVGSHLANSINDPKYSPLVAQPEESSYSNACSAIAEQIWRFNDQKASLYLQQRLKHAIPGEYEVIHEVIFSQIEFLMIHRFGNFLVQCMLELAHPEDASQFSSVIEGRVASLSKDQFCCHVIQKLLEVSPLVIQARLAAELLDDAVGTMTSPFGTHVWQKLFHLPWSSKLPSIISLANNAVHLESENEGWMLVAKNEAGCATIKSLLNSNLFDKDCQECIEQLLSNMQSLMEHSYGSALVCKLAIASSTRARAMALIFSKAYDYCKGPVSSQVLLQLIKLKIPSFPARLSAAIASYRTDLSEDKYGSCIIKSLESLQKGSSQ